MSAVEYEKCISALLTDNGCMDFGRRIWSCFWHTRGKQLLPAVQHENVCLPVDRSGATRRWHVDVLVLLIEHASYNAFAQDPCEYIRIDVRTNCEYESR